MIMTDSLPIPSKGLFYGNNEYGNPLDYIEVAYLTTEDEVTLCTPNLFNRGESLYRVLKNKIEPYNEGLKIDDLLINDVDFILLWLRENAFGNVIDFLDKEGKQFYLNTHNINIKYIPYDNIKNYNDTFIIDNITYKFKLLRIGDERKYKTKDSKINYYSASIKEINGVEYSFNDNKEYLLNTSLKHGKLIKKTIDSINFGVDRNTFYMYDNKNIKTEITFDEIFFGVSKENLQKNSILINDSIFYLLNEGQGYDNESIMKMPSHIRIYNIGKLSEKIKKHNDSINNTK